jgi:hypothetical protein
MLAAAYLIEGEVCQSLLVACTLRSQCPNRPAQENRRCVE